MQALHPSHFQQIENIAALKEKEVDEQPLVEQEAYNELFHTRGWKLLEGVMDDIIKDIDESVSGQMAAGASFEEIGKTSVLREITKDVIRRLRNKVGDAAEAVESRRVVGGK